MSTRALVLCLAAVLMASFYSLSLSACGGSGGGTGGGSGGGGGAALSCNTSSAKSGTLCQVNYYCPDGGEPAVYCGQQNDGGYDCACGPAAQSPMHFTSPDFCSDIPANTAARAQEANTKCGFGL
jgi:hypothetical protein